MDQVKHYRVLKRHHFWVLSVPIVPLCVGIWLNVRCGLQREEWQKN
jgi:hypothetical protein